jgi:hypothetical protein
MLAGMRNMLGILAFVSVVLAGCFLFPQQEKHKYSVSKTIPRADDRIYDVNVTVLAERAPEILRMIQEAERTGHAGAILDGATHERCYNAMKTYNPSPTGPNLHRYNGSTFSISLIS